jgi:ubiquinone/menaquinone biosynthesis C-methylase UbiE
MALAMDIGRRRKIPGCADGDRAAKPFLHHFAMKSDARQPGTPTVGAMPGRTDAEIHQMSDAASYQVDGHRRSADECRSLLAAQPPPDRQIKVMARIEGAVVVDVGCGTGLFVREASRRFPDRTIIGVDASDDDIRLARLLHPQFAGQFRRMSAYRLEFAEASVDCITLQEVLEHLEGAALAVKEANRVLRPGGVLVLSVPNPFYLWRIVKFVAAEVGNVIRRRRGRPPRLEAEILSADAAWDRHVHSWTPQTLLALLEVNGFAYVDHAYENGAANPLRRWFLVALPFLGPTLILAVRKAAAAPAELV